MEVAFVATRLVCVAIVAGGFAGNTGSGNRAAVQRVEGLARILLGFSCRRRCSEGTLRRDGSSGAERLLDRWLRGHQFRCRD